MHGDHTFLGDLALVLGVAAITTVVFHRLRAPVVLGYLLAGLIVGPHVPFGLVASLETVHTLAELGVILLMFSIGLEFGIRRLVRVGPRVGLVAVLEVGTMLWLGYVAAQLLGFPHRERVVAGALVAVSSTMIVARVVADRPLGRELGELVFGVLVVEDLLAVLLMAGLTSALSGRALPLWAVARTMGRLGAFLAVLVVAGLLVIPRCLRAVARLRSPETLLVASVGICFALALAARQAGYSVALGAFLAGSLVAESGAGKEVEPLVHPLRDMFGAVFFVAVGMQLDPALVVQHRGAVASLTAVVIAGKVTGVAVGAVLTGHTIRTAVRAGMTLGQIGEFSFLLAGAATAPGSHRGEYLPSVAVGVCVLTSFATPWLVRAADPVAAFVDRHLPDNLQTVLALHASWVERLRAGSGRDGPGRRIRRLIRLTLVDAALLAALVIGASYGMHALPRRLAARTALPLPLARGLLLAGAGALAAPFAVGIARCVRRLGTTLALRVLPATDTAAGPTVDLAAAPRRALVVAIQLALATLVGVPLVAVTQPFLPPFRGAAVLGVVLGVLGFTFWRSAADLTGHVRAGVQVVAEALAAHAPEDEHALDEVQRLLPGIGTLYPLRLAAGDGAVGQTLAALNLRVLTGASVLALKRDADVVATPSPHEALRAGDVLVLTGTADALAAARALLRA